MVTIKRKKNTIYLFKVNILCKNVDLNKKK